ncbi:MAG: hypothetical protein FWF06_07935 [Symbiobacteriaceae bacterium]|nr:hypothetical protein [Symbiobacteriaceae bacterium]
MKRKRSSRQTWLSFWLVVVGVAVLYYLLPKRTLSWRHQVPRKPEQALPLPEPASREMATAALEPDMLPLVLTVKAAPLQLVVFNQPYTVATWSELLIKLCEELILYRPYTMAALDKGCSLNTPEQTWFSYQAADIKLAKERLTNGVWLETAGSPEEISRLCQALLQLCGLAPETFSVAV